MDIRENIRIAIFSIKTNMMRSLLTMLGIIIGVASVISIITIGNGGRDYIYYTGNVNIDQKIACFSHCFSIFFPL